VVDVLVVLKVTLVLFVIIVGFINCDPANFTPLVPGPGEGNPDFVGGFNGILLGATLAFFGFIGFDEVTCMTAEAVRPKIDVPRALFGTIITISVLYMIASVSLVGMLPYYQIDVDEGFGSAFIQTENWWAMQVVMIGQILFVLPAVVLVSYLPQSRMQYSMALSGMLPPIFKKVNSKGTIFWGTLITGVFMTIIAAVVPFKNLNDLISGGILLSFILTNTSLVNIRSDQKATWHQAVYVLLMGIATCALNKIGDQATSFGIGLSCLGLGLVVLAYMYFQFTFSNYSTETFVTPLVPIVPGIAIFANFYLFWQLSWLGIAQSAGMLLIALVTYFIWGFTHAGDFAVIDGIAGPETSRYSPQAKHDAACKVDVL